MAATVVGWTAVGWFINSVGMPRHSEMMNMGDTLPCRRILGLPIRNSVRYLADSIADTRSALSFASRTRSTRCRLCGNLA